MYLSSYSCRNSNHNNSNGSSLSIVSLGEHSSSKPPLLLQIRLPRRSPKQRTHFIGGETESSKPIELPRNNYDISQSWRKIRNAICIAATPTPSCTTSDVLLLMDCLHLPVPIDIYASLVQECTLSSDSTRAAELHQHISRSGLKVPLPLLNRLLLMHVSCGFLDTARQLFDRMTLRDFISWATMIVGYANNTHYDEAISLFVKMQYQLSMLEYPTWIIACVLEACVYTIDLDLGKQLHGCLYKLGMANHDSFITSSLIQFYGKLKCIEGAESVFNQLSRHNTLTWTARIISSCTEERFGNVFSYFKEMGRAGIKKSTFTFSSILRACARIDDDGRSGRQVHANAIKIGLDTDTYVQCGLVDMYGRSGLLKDAKLVFEVIDDKGNVACWNAMVTACIRNGFYMEAIKLLYEMKATGMQPQESIVNEVRMACSNDRISLNQAPKMGIGFEIGEGRFQ
ncbi:pentatricopeptide repeat-containing protein At1g31790-like [Juglans regia]|uniref:Pentatricopeptide repeat-containing protein At1g31790-like n=1 Tax=Juglans regia TaxID=51240 RepID=A0A6P9ER56_JUGRE|nr:pentatricopeptide repeat-containing protein At1g31790-like [Juglans regia]